MIISAKNLDFKELNQKIRDADEAVHIEDCYGQRFICSGLKEKMLTINGTPGNALGAYLDGGTITVNGNAQDAVGDTMNDGKIVIHGNAGDALGYAMHGGRIFIRTKKKLTNLPEQFIERIASRGDLKEIEPYISEFAGYFGMDSDILMQDRFYLLKPNAKNPYKQLYTAN